MLALECVCERARARVHARTLNPPARTRNVYFSILLCFFLSYSVILFTCWRRLCCLDGCSFVRSLHFWISISILDLSFVFHFQFQSINSIINENIICHLHLCFGLSDLAHTKKYKFVNTIDDDWTWNNVSLRFDLIWFFCTFDDHFTRIATIDGDFISMCYTVIRFYEIFGTAFCDSGILG